MPAKTGSKSVCVCYLTGAIRSGFATSHPNRCSFIKQDASGNSIRLDRDMGQYRIRLTTAGMVARVRIVNSSRRALAEPEHKGSQKELPLLSRTQTRGGLLLNAEPQHFIFKRFTHDSPDGRNGTQARSRSLSPGKFGCSTSAYPVRYSCRRGARTSLFRPYQSSLQSRSRLFHKRQDTTDVVDAKSLGSGFPLHDIFTKLHQGRAIRQKY